MGIHGSWSWSLDEVPEDQLGGLDSTWAQLGQTKSMGTADKVEELLNSRRFKEAAGLRQPLAPNK